MEQAILLALSKYKNLSESEKKLIANGIVKFISDINDKPQSERTIVLEHLSKDTTINFAPVPGTCPRCGKSL
jgi:hypothetical protein